MKAPYKGKNGHIAIGTPDVAAAKADLESRLTAAREQLAAAQASIPELEGQISALKAGLTALENGHRLVGQPREDPSRRTISVSTALVSFLNGVSALGDVCSRMDAIQPGYAVTPALSGSMTLTPVWRVTTDTGAYKLDTVTGQVARLE